jgi:hypothetical protein
MSNIETVKIQPLYNTIDIPSGKKIDFSNFLHNQISQRYYLDNYLNINNTNIKKRDFNIYLKLQNILTIENFQYFIDNIKNCLKELIKPYFGINFNDTISKLDKLDEYETEINSIITNSFRESLKKLFNFNNITCLLSDDTNNTFDIYFTHIGDPKSIDNEILEFVFDETSKTMNFKNRNSIQMTIFINPKNIRKEVIKLLTDKKDSSLIYNETIFIPISNTLSVIFAESFITSLIQDYYSENRIVQFNQILNIINNKEHEQTFTKLLAGTNSNYNNTVDELKEKYMNIYNNFNLNKNAESNTILSPDFLNILNDIVYSEFKGICTHPILFYQHIIHMNFKEVSNIFETLKIPFIINESASIENLTKYSKKDTMDVRLFKFFIFLSKIIVPYLFSTYILLEGRKIKSNQSINSEIVNIIELSNFTITKNMNYGLLKNLITKISNYLEYIKVLENPLICNKYVIKCILDSIYKSNINESVTVEG